MGEDREGRGDTGSFTSLERSHRRLSKDHQSCNPGSREKRRSVWGGGIRKMCACASIGACLRTVLDLATRCGWRFARRGSSVDITASHTSQRCFEVWRVPSRLPKWRNAQAVWPRMSSWLRRLCIYYRFVIGRSEVRMCVARCPLLQTKHKVVGRDCLRCDL